MTTTARFLFLFIWQAIVNGRLFLQMTLFFGRFRLHPILESIKKDSHSPTLVNQVFQEDLSGLHHLDSCVSRAGNNLVPSCSLD